MTSKIELILGDCLEKLVDIPDGSVDMILADPPYGTTACAWDSVIPFEPMWDHLKRVIKPSGTIIMTASQPFTTILIASNMKMFKYCWVWDKHIPRGFQVAKYRPMNKHEDVVVFCEGKPKTYNPIKVEREKPVTVKNYSKRKSSNEVKYNSKQSYTYTHRNPDTIITGCWEANKGKIHPTQKPVTLMEYLIRTYTNEGETVLDFVMGSGTTGVACKNLNRSFIGIEKDEKYFNIAKERIENTPYQHNLFESGENQ